MKRASFRFFFRARLGLGAALLAAAAALLVPARAGVLSNREPGSYSSRLDGPLQERMIDMTTDSSGNVYIVGSFSSAAMTIDTFGDVAGDSNGLVAPNVSQRRVLRTAGGEDIFVAKYDAGGNLLWARSAGGTGNDYATGVTVDASGNVFITGSFSGTADIGGTSLTAGLQTRTGSDSGKIVPSNLSVQSELFVAMLSSNGTWRWAKKLEYTLYNRAATFSDYVKFDFKENAGQGTTPSGYLEDVGAGFSQQGTYKYGWVSSSSDSTPADNSDEAQQQNGSLDDSYIHTAGKGWRLDLPAGTYRVTIRSGDPDDDDSYYNSVLIGSDPRGQVTLTDYNADAGDQNFVTGSGEITLSNAGYILLREGPRADNNKISWVTVEKRVNTDVNLTTSGTFGITSGSNEHPGKAISVDVNGNLYVKGRFIDSQALDGNGAATGIYFQPKRGDTFLLSDGNTYQGARNAFVTKLKLSSAGADLTDPGSFAWDWLTVFGTGFVQNNNDAATSDAIDIAALVTDSAGDVLVTGSWRGRITAGGASTTVTNNGAATANTEGFFLRLRASDGSRNLLSTIRTNLATDANLALSPEAIAQDSVTGDAFVLVNFNPRLGGQSGGQTWRLLSATGAAAVRVTSSNTRRDFFVARIDGSGEWKGTAQPGGTGQRTALALAIDPASRLFVTGSLQSGPVTFGNTSLSPSAMGNVQPFIARLNWPAGSAAAWSAATTETAVVSIDTPLFAVNSNGPDYVDVNGQLWSADAYFSSSGSSTYPNTAIADTADPTLYRTERHSPNFTYSFPTGGGYFQVTTRFAENFWSFAGARRMNASLEGTPFLSNADIFTLAGGIHRAYDVASTAYVIDGALTVNFAGIPTANDDNAFVNAISVRQLPIGFDAGGSGGFTASDGIFYTGDFFVSGQGTPLTTTNTIANTTDQTLYRTQAVGSASGTLTYAIPLRNGEYNVTLKWADLTGGNDNTYQTVRIENQVSERYHIPTSAGGAFRAFDRTLSNITVADGTLNITINAQPFSGAATSTTRPRLNGLSITPVAASRSHGVGVAVAPNGTIWWLLSSGRDSGLDRDLAGNGTDTYGDYGASYFIGNRTGANRAYDETKFYGGILLAANLDLSSAPVNNASGYYAGQEIPPPAGVATDTNGRPFQPEIEVNGQTNGDTSAWFYWDTAAKKLFAVSPLPAASLRWRVSPDPANPGRLIVPVATRWPTDADGPGALQTHVIGAGVAGDEPQVDLNYGLPRTATFATILYTSAGSTQAGNRLRAPREGYTTLLYVEGDNPAVGINPAVVQAVRHVRWQTLATGSTPWTIGTEITFSGHEDTGKNGFVVNPKSRYDGEGTSAAHKRDLREGPIIPVNRDEPTDEQTALVVLWYGKGTRTGVFWPETPIRYAAQWPASPDRIVITSSQGSDVAIPTASGQVYPQENLDPAKFQNMRIYHQPDKAKAGYNPNEEHALLADSQTRTGTSVFALRNDLNHLDPNGTNYRTSDPYVLLKYQDGMSNGRWKMKIYKVELTGSYVMGSDSVNFNFLSYRGFAGNRVQAPFPLSILGDRPETTGGGMPYWQDRTGAVWARSAGSLTVGYWYPKRADFWYDRDSDGVDDNVPAVPWLEFVTPAQAPDNATAAAGDPININYTIIWPVAPELAVGDTLTNARGGLPDIRNWASADFIFDENVPQVANVDPVVAATGDPRLLSARIFDAVSPRAVPFTARNLGGTLENTGGNPLRIEDGPAGKKRFSDLPPHLKARVLFNPNAFNGLGGLEFSGVLANDPTGAASSLVNVMSPLERQEMLLVDDPASGPTSGSAWDVAVRKLYVLSRNPNALDLNNDQQPDDALLYGLLAPATTGGKPRLQSLLGGAALTAGPGSGIGYVTLAENNHPTLTGYPVALHVIKVVNPPVTGHVDVVLSDNVFDERLTLRHNQDFGGDPSQLFFEWYYLPDSGGPAPTTLPTDGAGWTKIAEGFGVNSVTVGGSGLRTLQDGWIYARYRGYHAGIYSAQTFGFFAGDRSGTDAQPRPAHFDGWIKRVLTGVNAFDQRVTSFHQSPATTYVSLVQQAGTRYEGAVAFNPTAENLNSLGLIPLYETVIRRGLALSINGTPAQTTDGVNNALLFAASRISDLYMLIANEAYGDAQDPTIGFNTAGGPDFGTLSSSVFAFQNQLPSLLDEELCLLRGRDNSGAGVAAAPVYNRLFWNFTSGLEGEPAYVLNYNITDQNADGFINATDAAILFPQGHGDAWGHYLSATKIYYRLLRHPLFAWVPRSETVSVVGVALNVDFLDETKFARAAAAKARTGREIVDLTYRKYYVADPRGQWQGYKDADAQRAWGVDEWSRRAGQAAVFDWAVANAILPPTSTRTGLEKIDRTTITELREIAAQFGAIQGTVDKADRGLNPLGLTGDTIPFDVDPAQVSAGQTHFEQIFDRAAKAVANAKGVYDFANQTTQRLRQIQLTANDFAAQVAGQERDFRNRLIEIFGYPHEGDIGSGRAYPNGYDGPDIYKWMYVDVAEYSQSALPAPAFSFTGYFSALTLDTASAPGPGGVQTLGNLTGYFFPDDVANLADLQAGAGPDGKPVGYPMLSVEQRGASAWAFQKSADMGIRRAPGRLQQALGEMVQKEVELDKAVTAYSSYVQTVQDEVQLLAARYAVASQTIQVRESSLGTIESLNTALTSFRTTIAFLSAAGQGVKDISDGIAEAIPTTTGTSTDPYAPLRGGLRIGGAAASLVLNLVGAGLEGASAGVEAAKEIEALKTDLSITTLGLQFEIIQHLKTIEQLMRDESDYRVAIFQKKLDLDASIGEFRRVLAEGERLLEERLIQRQKVAGPIQALRYQDIAFRNFRNDALQKYRASFDLAAQYVYLAARTYDYETNLLGGASASAGQTFLTDIVRQRSLGQFINGQPVNGVGGLSDPMARMGQNFAVLKGQFGFNNPQVETGRFSLRTELFRILAAGNADGDDAWRGTLQKMRVDDLWSVPEFRRYCRPFAPESSGAQPGLVIPFNTEVTFGLNFFGWPLAGGDSSYDSSNFATKIRSVGVWFENYNGHGLSVTPRVYLVPAGQDVMRSPTGNSLATREFTVVDQALPVPFPIGQADLTDPNYIPDISSLDGDMATLRRFNRFRAYHDGGFTVSEMTTDSRLIGRSVWNTRWLLIIPGGTFLNDPNSGLDTFIRGSLVPGSSTERDGNGVRDIKLFFQTYAYPGL